MIPAIADTQGIADWGNTVPWPSADQLEQDLTLARMIVEIANDPYLGDELVFRGGTCLHKLHLNPGLRYSEDHDHVRRTAGSIGELLAALRNVGERLRMNVAVDVSKYPKVRFRSKRQTPRDDSTSQRTARLASLPIIRQRLSC